MFYIEPIQRRKYRQEKPIRYGELVESGEVQPDPFTRSFPGLVRRAGVVPKKGYNLAYGFQK